MHMPLLDDFGNYEFMSNNTLLNGDTSAASLGSELKITSHLLDNLTNYIHGLLGVSPLQLQVTIITPKYAALNSYWQLS